MYVRHMYTVEYVYVSIKNGGIYHSEVYVSDYAYIYISGKLVFVY